MSDKEAFFYVIGGFFVLLVVAVTLTERFRVTVLMNTGGYVTTTTTIPGWVWGLLRGFPELNDADSAFEEEVEDHYERVEKQQMLEVCGSVECGVCPHAHGACTLRL